MRLSALISTFALALTLCAGSVLAGGPGDEGNGEEQAQQAMALWKTSNIAPKLIAHCSRDFPDKADVYGKALARWQEESADIAGLGKMFYALYIRKRLPGREPEEVLATGVERALALYDAKSQSDKLMHCESAFMALMVDIGADTGAPE